MIWNLQSSSSTFCIEDFTEVVLYWAYPILLKWSKSFAFGYMRLIFAALDGFCVVANQIELGDAKLAWCSPIITHQICFYSLEHSHRIHSFRLTLPSLIVEVLAILVKFLNHPLTVLWSSVPSLFSLKIF